MKINTTACAFLVLDLLVTGIARAQTFALPFSISESSSTIVFSLDAYGVLLSSGTENGSAVLSSAEQGAGTRLLWYPGKAAFRAGNVTGTAWDEANVGAYSTALGQDTVASGANSFAAGYGSVASGNSSVALGGGRAMGGNSLAEGLNATASGGLSMAFGAFAYAGSSSFALGTATYASGNCSLASGQFTWSEGDYSVSFNQYTVAPALLSTAIGTYNVALSSTGATPSPTAWVATDPLFEVGNGTYSTPSDALVVYKNGNAAVQGTLAAHTGLRCAPGGDLTMGSFTAGTAP